MPSGKQEMTALCAYLGVIITSTSGFPHLCKEDTINCKEIPESHTAVKDNDTEQSSRITNSLDNFPVVALS